MLQLERIERDVVALRAALAAAGAKRLPDLDDAIAAFDAALVATPAAVSPDRAALLEALGVTDAR